MAFISFEQAGGRNLVAFLDMVAWAEGTDKPSQPTKDHGHDVLVGGGLFDGYADHPYVPALRVFSTAAGRYQLLRRYYDAYRKTLRLSDFSPLSQDLIALQQIRERRALGLIQAGRIQEAIAKLSSIWASLPGAGYKQHVQKLDDVIAAYLRAGGQVAEE
ncbi:glycoside hydrolase family 24 protein [Xanthomonas oryzae]|uniref:glycoside hydrolase family 24 protein n=1 Tax=Xanthomonas oryzae TaxID=347 RepID=UPI001034933E|nr:glycoside hydrolase family 104 protein [Xanthomonas oryzae]QBH02015.1 lysozyme [Xanthomonas oryzae]